MTDTAKIVHRMTFALHNTTVNHIPGYTKTQCESAWFFLFYYADFWYNIKKQSGDLGVAMNIEWIDGHEIRVKIDDDAVVIAANREGLLSLAKQLAALAETVPGQHIHYDEYNSLESGSKEMIIVKAK